MTQDEFDRLLDELHGAGGSPSAAAAQPAPTPASTPATQVGSAGIANQIQSETGDITDDEFERLLDDLHGAGRGPGGNDDVNAAAPAAPVTPVSTSTVPSDTGASSGDGDLMTDDEFERLLDELHGSGKGPTDEELEMATRPVADMLADTPAAASPRGASDSCCTAS